MIYHLPNIKDVLRYESYRAMAWEDALVRKGWIDNIGGGEYQISDAGIEWKEK
jgi:hypothetical protein